MTSEAQVLALEIVGGLINMRKFRSLLKQEEEAKGKLNEFAASFEGDEDEE